MDDLISRVAAIDALTDENIEMNFDSVYDGEIHRTKRAAIRIVANLPTVDAVPVVRCKDCKYAHMTYDGEVKYCDRISMPDDEGDYGYALYLPGDWFCADGERRDSE